MNPRKPYLRPGRTETSGIIVPPTGSRASASNTSANVIRPPMPGRVISVLVRPGDRVSAGQEMCVVEAMKMEQSIRANHDGVVKAVLVQLMDSVQTNDPLLELE